MKARLSPFLFLPVLVLASFNALAVTKTNDFGNLNLAGSWTGGTAPDGTTTASAGVAQFDTSITGVLAQTYTLGGDVTWGMIRVDRTTATGGALITISGSNTITLNGNNSVASGRQDAILLNSGTGSPLQIDSNLILGAANGTTEYFTASRNLTLNGAVDLSGVNLNAFTAGGTSTYNGILSNSEGTSNLVKSGSGTLILANNNSYNGTTSVTAGELQALSSIAAGAKSNFSTGSISLTGGTLRFKTGSTSNAQSYGNAINLNGSTLISEDGVVTYGGATSLTGTNVFNVVYDTKNAIFTNTVSGAGGLTKTGAGALILNGANSYAGATAVSAGRLQVGDGGTTGNIGTGTVSVAVGASLFFNRSDLLDYKASARMRTVSGAGDIVLDGGVKFFNYTGTGSGFSEAGSWNGFSGNLIIKGGSEFQTIRNGATAMGTAKIVLGNASSSGKLSQTEGNWTWTNNIQLVGAANQIVNNGTGADRFNKIQGVISGSGNVTFSDSTGAMNNADRGFILTGSNTMEGLVTVDSFVRVGGVVGNDASLSAGASGTLGSASVVINTGKRLTFSRTDTHTVANSISGSGGISIGSTGITGTGTQVLTYSGTATYTGATSVSAGKLLVNGSLGNTTVNVATGATLGGTGTIAGAVNVSGVLSPGASVASFSTGALSFSTGSTFACEVDSTVGLASGADLQSVAGNLNLVGTVDLTLVDLAAGGPAVAFAENTVFTLINYTGSWNGGFFTFDSSSLADGDTFTAGLNLWRVDYNATTGGSNFAGEYVAGNFVNITAVPEPAAGLIGGVGILFLLRRRRS